jgi:hypothetical protein
MTATLMEVEAVAMVAVGKEFFKVREEERDSNR